MSKLQVKWKGPRRVASVKSDYVFVVEDLLSKELKAAHATRLRSYQNKELNVTAELAHAVEHQDPELYVVSKILDARCNEQEIFHELLIAWRGFSVEVATWEPYSVIAVDVPEMWQSLWSLLTIQTWCARYDLFESSHGEVLRVAKDENAVDIICRTFSCNFLRKRLI
jgi:hypothetical protein